MPYLLPGTCSAPVKAPVSSLKAPPAAGVLLTLQGLENRNCLTTWLFMWGRGEGSGPFLPGGSTMGKLQWEMPYLLSWV